MVTFRTRSRHSSCVLAATATRNQPCTRAAATSTPRAHLVLDLSGLACLTVQGQRLVQVVLGEVSLHVAHHQQLALDRPARVHTGQHVELADHSTGKGSRSV